MAASLTIQAWKLHQMMKTDFKQTLGLKSTANSFTGKPPANLISPAKVIITVGLIEDLDREEPVMRTSAVTKRRYAKIKKRSGQIPFGRSTTNVKDAAGNPITNITEADYGEIMQALIANGQLDTSSTWRLTGIGFKPEIYKANRDTTIVIPPTNPNALG